MYIKFDVYKDILEYLIQLKSKQVCYWEAHISVKQCVCAVFKSKKFF